MMRIRDTFEEICKNNILISRLCFTLKNLRKIVIEKIGKVKKKKSLDFTNYFILKIHKFYIYIFYFCTFSIINQI